MQSLYCRQCQLHSKVDAICIIFIQQCKSTSTRQSVLPSYFIALCPSYSISCKNNRKWNHKTIKPIKRSKMITIDYKKSSQSFHLYIHHHHKDMDNLSIVCNALLSLEPCRKGSNIQVYNLHNSVNGNNLWYYNYYYNLMTFNTIIKMLTRFQCFFPY